MVWLIVLLTLSVLINVGLVWYIRYAVKKLLFVSDNFGELMERLSEYQFHLETVNSMETYYGDQIIENLIKHNRNMIEEVKAYKEIYSLTHDVVEEDTETTTNEERKEKRV